VLNRFDEILQSVTSKYALEFVQKQAFETPDRLVLLAVLKFSKFLWENCTNRSLYASFEVRIPGMGSFGSI
jgi:E3 ubiquitin-protein ligase HUWE1